MVRKSSSITEIILFKHLCIYESVIVLEKCINLRKYNRLILGMEYNRGRIHGKMVLLGQIARSRLEKISHTNSKSRMKSAASTTTHPLACTRL
jgi:hypothetical protein